MRKSESAVNRCKTISTVQKLLGGKYKIELLWYIGKCDVRRFGQLHRQIEEITESSLTKQLRELEADGFITRHDFGEVPPHVEYSLTELGKSFLVVLDCMKAWGDENLMSIQYFKLEIFIPEANFRQLQKTLQEVDAGHIGCYDSCLSYSHVTGTWRPLTGSDPYIGTENEVSEEPELKVEVTCKAENLQQTMEAVKAVHPYEEPVINVIPLYQVGIGENEAGS